MSQIELFTRPGWLSPRDPRTDPRAGDVVAGWRVVQRSPYPTGLLVFVEMADEPRNCAWVAEWAWALLLLEADGHPDPVETIRGHMADGGDWRALL